MIAEGTVIDSRYRVLGKLGAGGMADVYCAEDTHLGRKVALKLLHARFAQDQEFVERFRREASSAAGLQHPNVVGVYDRGEFDGTYYIAMEYCEGRTLKDIVARTALDPARAIAITKQMLVAARFAHRRNVIHRDLKPHNVILDDEDNVKVTDFGIARAGASDITEVGAIMGTAQYLSPEQAQGRPVTEASDLYSIGVVLFEMLTGKRSVRRGQCGGGCAQAREPAGPLSARGGARAAAGARGGGAEGARQGPRAALRRRGLVHQGPRGGRGASAPGPGGRREHGRVRSAWRPPRHRPPSRPCRLRPRSRRPSARRRRAGPPSSAGDRGAARGDRRTTAAAGGSWPRCSGDWPSLPCWRSCCSDPRTRPPSRRSSGRPWSRPAQRVDRAGLDVEVKRRTDQAPRDFVFEQSPNPGQEVDQGSVVTLFVSNGPSTVRVPDVVGQQEADARRRLRRADLRPDVEREASTKVAEGIVIRTDPGPGRPAERDSAVTLVVSSGPDQVTVPSVIGETQEDAVARLREDGPEPDRARTRLQRAGRHGHRADACGRAGGGGGIVRDDLRLERRGARGPRRDRQPQSEAEADLDDAGFGVNVRTRDDGPARRGGDRALAVPAWRRRAPGGRDGHDHGRRAGAARPGARRREGGGARRRPLQRARGLARCRPPRSWTGSSAPGTRRFSS